MENRIFALNTALLMDSNRFDAAYRKQRPERRERVDRMRFDTGKRLCLASGIVMEQALAYAGCEDHEIVLTPEGKPTVDGCFFNLSDTGEVAVCAVSDREVGIDIEQSSRKLTDAVIRKAFTPNEIRLADGNNDTLIRLWTVKESVMKWYGLGLSLMPEFIEIRMDPVPDERNSASGLPADMAENLRITIFDHPELDAQAERLHFSFYKHEDYRITVCSEYGHFTDTIEWLQELF